MTSEVDWVGAATAAWAVLAVAGVLVFARLAQRRLVARTAAEIERTLSEADDETTTVEASCEESSAEQFGELRKRLHVMELDDGERAATEAFVQEETAAALQRAAEHRPRVYNFDNEKKLASEVEQLFETLQTLWPVEKTAQEDAPARAGVAEVKALIAQLIHRFGLIDAKYKEDRVSASQCMSMCCTALMKYDGLYVLDSIRKTCEDDALSAECQQLIEKAVPNIWAT